MAESPEASRARAMAAVQGILDLYKTVSVYTPVPTFDAPVMSAMKLVSATAAGTAVFELEITAGYANLNGVMHGGAAGVIFDMCTTMALGPLAKTGFWDFLGGVSRTLNISYLKAVPIGTKVLIQSQVLQAGRTMAMMRGSMTSLDGKIIYCTCEHHKVAVPTKKEHLEVLEQLLGGSEGQKGSGRGSEKVAKL